MLKKIKMRIFNTHLGMSIIHYFRNNSPKLKVMNSKDSINYILKTNCSVARFGEGEFEIILGSNYQNKNGVAGFQESNAELINKLKETLASQNSNLLICVPYALNNIFGRTKDSRNFWFFWCERENQRKRITELILSYHDAQKVFGDTQISRPYIAYNSKKNADAMFPKIKKLWLEKDIIIVEGTKTRLGVGNDLFDNARTIKRILCPPTNAFNYLDEINKKINEIYNGELIILALGPTATILASYLSLNGIQAIDIGHVDIEYEWYLRSAKKHDLIPGKYTNEAVGGNNVRECNDLLYNSQIIARI